MSLVIGQFINELEQRYPKYARSFPDPKNEVEMLHAMVNISENLRDILRGERLKTLPGDEELSKSYRIEMVKKLDESSKSRLLDHKLSEALGLIKDGVESMGGLSTDIAGVRMGKALKYLREGKFIYGTAETNLPNGRVGPRNNARYALISVMEDVARQLAKDNHAFAETQKKWEQYNPSVRDAGPGLL